VDMIKKPFSEVVDARADWNVNKFNVPDRHHSTRVQNPPHISEPGTAAQHQHQHKHKRWSFTFCLRFFLDTSYPEEMEDAVG